jgi:hypothetical protein
MHSKLRLKLSTYIIMMKQKRHYDPEFKRVAIELVETSNNSATDIVNEL